MKARTNEHGVHESHNCGFEDGSISENKKNFLENSKADLLCFLPHPLMIALSKLLLPAKIVADRRAKVLVRLPVLVNSARSKAFLRHGIAFYTSKR